MSYEIRPVYKNPLKKQTRVHKMVIMVLFVKEKILSNLISKKHLHEKMLFEKKLNGNLWTNVAILPELLRKLKVKLLRKAKNPNGPLTILEK